MATTRINRNSSRRVTRDGQDTMAEQIEHAHEITSDIIEYLTDYARENPGHAALDSLGVGFLLGWNLKPW